MAAGKDKSASSARSTQQNGWFGTPAVGLLVFNLATVNDVVPGFYFWTGTAWQPLVASTYPAGSVFCASGQTDVVDVTSVTGKAWMDRNLGASQVADSSTDVNAYGDLYQWGRGSDGHQCRTSSTTSTLSSSDQPGHNDFITISSSPYDWRSGQNDNLWQGISGTNNPCPIGYLLPTDAELEAERVSWGSGNSNAAGAFASPLKLPVAGTRTRSNGSLSNVGTYGRYWSSTVSSTDSRYLFFSSYAGIYASFRARGYAVRCLKD